MQYLLSASLLLLLAWPLYHILLTYSARYVVNRVCLLLAMVAVCALPFVEFSSPAPAVTRTVQTSLRTLEASVTRPAPAPVAAVVPDETSAATTVLEVVPAAAPYDPLLVVYLVGLATLALLLVARLLALLSLHLRSRPTDDGEYRLLPGSAGGGQAFTFGRTMYFSPELPADADFGHVLEHERVHARQWHTVDVLATEIFLCVFWFHPAAWWLRGRVRANLEYLVDRAVVSHGTDRRAYQMALVRQSQGAQGLALSLPFSEPSLKSRITRLTGLAEYRWVAAVAAVALVAWLGVGIMIINGRVAAPETDYLTAAAGPGDMYYDHYRETLPAEITSVEIYLNRMVSVNEYLHLRGIVSQVPGARLYLYNAPHDRGYTLELQLGAEEAGVVRYLETTSNPKYTAMLGLEHGGRAGQYHPVAMHLQRYDPEDRGDMITYLTHKQPNSEQDFFQMTPAALGNGLRVYVNRKPVDVPAGYGALVGVGTARLPAVNMNGRDVTRLGADDWPLVRVEGRVIPRPLERMNRLLKSSQHAAPHTIVSGHQPDGGTFREWFEKTVGERDGTSGHVLRYNDRFASLSLLLDTDFGPDALMQIAYSEKDPAGGLIVQVIDDNAYLAEHGAVTSASAVLPATLDELEVYLRRLPTPAEARQIRSYLAGTPLPEMRVFQECKYAAGQYSLKFGHSDTFRSGFDALAVGERYDAPLRFQIKRSGNSFGTTTFRPGAPAPAGAPHQDVFLRVNGEWVTLAAGSDAPYTQATLDPPPPAAELACLAGVTPQTAGLMYWSASRTFAPGDQFNVAGELLKMNALDDRPRAYYLGTEQVDERAFYDYRRTAGGTLQIAALDDARQQPVVVRIVP